MKIKLHRDLLTPEILEKYIVYTDSYGDLIIEKDLNKDYFRTATVSMESTGKYHVSILTDDGEEAP